MDKRLSLYTSLYSLDLHSESNSSARPQPKDIKLVMWKDGFTVDNGPHRRYDDPANKQFLDEITQGRLPMELRALGTEVNVSMEDRRKDDYEENKPKEEFKVRSMKTDRSYF